MAFVLRKQDRRQRGRNEEPSAGSIDTQSIETIEIGGERGYDAAKNVKGCKRHIVVDTVGNLLKVMVHAAGIQDYEAARALLEQVSQMVTTLEKLWADAIYKRDGLVEWVRETLQTMLKRIATAC